MDDVYLESHAMHPMLLEDTFVGFASMLWPVPMSSLTFIILPNIVSPRIFFICDNGQLHTKRGHSQGGIIVSGMGSCIGGRPSSGHHVRQIK
jgi:hypothetical protein